MARRFGYNRRGSYVAAAALDPETHTGHAASNDYYEENPQEYCINALEEDEDAGIARSLLMQSGSARVGRLRALESRPARRSITFRALTVRADLCAIAVDAVGAVAGGETPARRGANGLRARRCGVPHAPAAHAVGIVACRVFHLGTARLDHTRVARGSEANVADAPREGRRWGDLVGDLCAVDATLAGATGD